MINYTHFLHPLDFKGLILYTPETIASSDGLEDYIIIYMNAILCIMTFDVDMACKHYCYSYRNDVFLGKVAKLMEQSISS